MASLIQFKRSLDTADPGLLANGEPAFTANGDVLFLGSNGATVPIAGRRVPGVLTANQALVTNSTNMIDRLLFGNSTVNAVANSTAFSLANSTVTFTITKPTAAQQAGAYYLKADGTYGEITLGAAEPGGDTTEIQFNNSGVLDGDPGFTWTAASNTATLSNAIAIGVQATVGANVTLTTVNLLIGNSTVNSVSNSIIHIVRNASASANLTADGLVAGTTVANSSQVSLGGNAIHTSTTFAVGNSTVNSTSNSSLLSIRNASATANLSPAAGLVLSTTVVNTTQITVAGGPTINATTLSVTDAVISGNLTVSGTVTTVDAVNLVIQDPLIRLADDQANTASYTDTADIGYFGTYGNTTQLGYTGLFRDASDSGIFKLFNGQIPVPTTTVDTANVNFALSTLQAYLKSGALVSNGTNLNITANSTLAVALVANSLTLTTALAGTAGGTGHLTTTAEDLLVGNSTNGYRKLAVGAEGRVLQVSSGVVAWGTIDGGTF
jgi:hypothetical protein